MSGSALSPWALVQEPSRYAAQVAIHANCSPELPHPHLLKCLRERPLEVLMSTPVIAPEFAFAFGPSVDGVVIDTGEPPGENCSNLDVYRQILKMCFSLDECKLGNEKLIGTYLACQIKSHIILKLYLLICFLCSAHS